MNKYARLEFNKTQKGPSPFTNSLRQNKLYYSIKSYSVDCTDKKLSEIGQIFTKAIGQVPVKPKFHFKTVKAFPKPSPSKVNSIYKPLTLKCYTPTFRVKKPLNRPLRAKNYSILGKKIESWPQQKNFPDHQDASTFT